MARRAVVSTYVTAREHTKHTHTSHSYTHGTRYTRCTCKATYRENTNPQLTDDDTLRRDSSSRGSRAGPKTPSLSPHWPPAAERRQRIPAKRSPRAAAVAAASKKKFVADARPFVRSCAARGKGSRMRRDALASLFSLVFFSPASHPSSFFLVPRRAGGTAGDPSRREFSRARAHPRSAIWRERRCNGGRLYRVLVVACVCRCNARMRFWGDDGRCASPRILKVY